MVSGHRYPDSAIPQRQRSQQQASVASKYISTCSNVKLGLRLPVLCQVGHSVRQDGSASQLEVANEESAVRVRPSPPLSRNCDGVRP